MGGKVAMVFAADYPEKVRKLIIADIAPRNYLEADNMSQYHLHRNILLAILELDVSVLNSRRQAEERLAEKIDNPLITQFLLKNIKHDPLTRRMQWRLNAEALYNNLEEIVEGVNRRWFDDRIPITSYPVVFIRGLKSAYIRDSDIPGIREIYPDAEIIDIPDAGHWLHADQSGLFLRAVMEYC